MIEKMLENWLTKASERSYQLPFCFLLMQQGKTVIHLTRHCGMEHGKDVIALDKDGSVHVYQLKGLAGSRLKLSDWQGMQNQMMQMVYTPCEHPSITSDKHHTSYLVVNGDIEEEVQSAITAFNDDWDKKGQPQYKLNTIVKGQLLSMALASKEQFFPSEIQDMKSVFEFFLEDGTGFVDKGKLSRLLDGHFNLEDLKSEAAFRRCITSGALLCSLCINSYANQDNHVAIAESWLIYIISVFKAVDSTGRKIELYKEEIELAQKIIKSALLNLIDEAKEFKEFMSGNLMTDSFVYQHRTTILLGLIAWAGFADETCDKQQVELILAAHFDKFALWGESGIPYLLAVYFFYRRHQSEDSADQYLAVLLLTFVERIFTTTGSFTDVYTNAEDSVINQFKSKTEDQHSPRISYVLESLIILASRVNLKNVMAEIWPRVSECLFVELKIKRPVDYYSWRISDAEEVTRHPMFPKSWADLLQEAVEYETDSLPPSLLKYPALVPLYWIVFPHRLCPKLARWYGTNFRDLIKN